RLLRRPPPAHGLLGLGRHSTRPEPDRRSRRKLSPGRRATHLQRLAAPPRPAQRRRNVRPPPQPRRSRQTVPTRLSRRRRPIPGRRRPPLPQNTLQRQITTSCHSLCRCRCRLPMLLLLPVFLLSSRRALLF